jgi:hypothetical protein
LVAVVFLAAACARAPVTDEVTVELVRGSEVAVVTAATYYDLKAANAAAISRIESARAAAVSSTDPWSYRFGRVTPEVETVTFRKNRGALESVVRSVRIPSTDLQQVFSDTNITVHVLHGAGWSELSFYPGTNSRATRQQQVELNTALTAWSAAVARYYTAVDHLYSYLNANPQRAPYVFDFILGEKGSDGAEPVVLEEEQPFVDEVRTAMEEIAARMDDDEGHADTLAEEADLVYNPFPGRMTITLPGEILSSEGFTKTKEGTTVVEPVDLFTALAALEGRWVEPDPLVALLREQQTTGAQMAALVRRSTPFVPATDVAEAIREKLVRPKTYTVRWKD